MLGVILRAGEALPDAGGLLCDAEAAQFAKAKWHTDNNDGPRQFDGKRLRLRDTDEHNLGRAAATTRRPVTKGLGHGFFCSFHADTKERRQVVKHPHC